MIVLMATSLHLFHLFLAHQHCQVGVAVEAAAAVVVELMKMTQLMNPQMMMMGESSSTHEVT